MSDMGKDRWLSQKPNGVWRLRAFVPKHLQVIAGKKEITKSFDTSNKADALGPYRLAAAGTQELFDSWQAIYDLGQAPTKDGTAKEITTHFTRLHDARVNKWCADHYLRVVDEEFAWRSESWKAFQADPTGFMTDHLLEDPQIGYYEEMTPHERFASCARSVQLRRFNALEEALSVADCSRSGEQARQLLANEDASAADQMRLCRRLMEAERDALRAILGLKNGRVERLPPDHFERTPTVTATTAKQSDPGPLISTLLSQFGYDHKDALARKTIMSNDSDVREFIDIVGDKKIRDYTNEDGLLFKKALRTVPSQRKVDPFKGLSISRCAALAEKLDPSGKRITRLAVATVNNKLFAVGSFFEWADKQYKLVDNPLSGKRIDTGKRKKSGKQKMRKPFKVEHLNTLFNGPIYTGCKSLRQWKVAGPFIPRDSARFWAPLIALFSGMRMGEIIQLRTNDYQVSEAGIAFFNVRTQLDEDDDEADPSLKNDNSIRQIPVHSTLISVGFADLIARRRAEGAVRLFPEYDRATDESWSKTFSSWFRQYRSFLGVSLVIRKVNRLVFHSFRHSFEDVVRNHPDAKKEFRDALQGRAEQGSADDYGEGVLLERLHETIELVNYKGLDLSHLFTSETSNENRRSQP